MYIRLNSINLRKAVLFQLILAISLLVIPGVANGFDPSGLLEIHYINVGWGTSVLVIGPDGITILIDGGRDNMGASQVIPYMQSLGLMAADGLDYVLASHLHSDHIAGLTQVMNSGYDVRNAVYFNGSNNSNSYVTAFRTAASNTTAGPIVALALGAVIQLGDSATATCVAANGSVWGHGAIPGGQADENDRSIGLLIRYRDFDYIFTGDMGGGESDQTCTGRSTGQVNIETPMVQAIMPGGEHPLLSSYGVEVAHVSHHGSESSTNSDYMNYLTPKFACIAVGSGQSADYMFPRHDVVDNVLRAGVYCITAPAATVLQNEEGQPAGGLTSYAGYCVGDIIIKTDGAANYIVDGSGGVTEGPDERSILGMPLTVPFDEPPPAPIISVISPNGGEQWAVSTQQNIAWSVVDSAGVVSYSIDYSTNMGISWLPIQPQTGGNPQVFSWTVPETPSNDCVVRVSGWNEENNVGSDNSDGNFIITNTPQCNYIIGDINGDSTVLAGDVTYGVRFFKGLGLPPPDSCSHDSINTPNHYLYVAGDVNGDCLFRGSDISRLVSYFKGTSVLTPCQFFPLPLLKEKLKVKTLRN
jgi:beta-lactamase superfamily II metal-dependent hydrolase